MNINELSEKQDRQIVFLHGLQGSSHGVKANLLRGYFPKILIPDFIGSLEERMAKLDSIIGINDKVIMIGSSFGGLMSALFTCQKPEQVEKSILLAPALIWPDFASSPPDPVQVPVIIYHGINDQIVPLQPVRELAEKVFINLSFYAVDDDHGLYKTVHELDWIKLLGI